MNDTNANRETTMKLMKCPSHERFNSPAAFEPVFEGTLAECVAWYNDLPHAVRCANAYKVRDDDGTEMDMQEANFEAVKSGSYTP